MNEERRRDYPEILTKLDEIAKDVKHIQYILNGNGTPGLCAKVAENSDFVRGIRKASNYILTVVLIGGILGFMFVAFNHAVGLNG